MHTYLPTISSYSGYPPFCMAVVNSNHYVVLHFKKVNVSIPAPPIDGRWLRKSSSRNKNVWLQSLENDVDMPVILRFSFCHAYFLFFIPIQFVLNVRNMSCSYSSVTVTVTETFLFLSYKKLLNEIMREIIDFTHINPSPHKTTLCSIQSLAAPYFLSSPSLLTS
ncbi:expressed protein [Phakopsora pachyrhizi]|uniref:Expressed protein n=1 Tax=Phakopsora pachyrhizi TaxID=170000 RepID=A0AAV0AZ13_PHAPC|nr:expressed protein [Phakopsora pachyrhizi]